MPLDNKAFSELQDRIFEVNRVITKLDTSIRVAAFDFLKPYISSGKISPPIDPRKPETDGTSTTDIDALVQKHSDGKPNENVNLLAAIWFSEYGSHAFSLDYLRDRAATTGLTIPARPRMTLVSAKDKGKKLYGFVGQGLFKPTVIGEAFFKTKYEVKKGTKVPATEK
jgi:hypothetical protein